VKYIDIKFSTTHSFQTSRHPKHDPGKDNTASVGDGEGTEVVDGGIVPPSGPVEDYNGQTIAEHTNCHNDYHHIALYE
jgi:hypothetical protein